MRRAVLTLLAFAAPLAAQQRNTGAITSGGAENFPTSNLGSSLCVETDVAAATTGTTRELLATCTIPGGSLGGDFAGLTVAATFATAANVNSKLAEIDLDGTNIMDATTTGNAEPVTLRFECYVADSDKVTCGALQTYDTGPNGDVYSAPALTDTFTFSGDLDVDFYATTASASGDLTLTAYRVALISAYGTDPDSFWPLRAPDGTAAVTPYGFASSPGTGMFLSGADTLAFATDETEQWIINAGGDLYPATNITQDFGQGNNRIRLSYLDEIWSYGIFVNGVNYTRLTIDGPIITMDGAGVGDTGLMRISNNTASGDLIFGTQSVDRLTLTDTDFTSTEPFLAPNGTGPAPGYGFAAVAKVGTYAVGTSVRLSNAIHATTSSYFQSSQDFFLANATDTATGGRSVSVTGDVGSDFWRARVSTSTGNYTNLELGPLGLALSAAGTGVGQFLAPLGSLAAPSVTIAGHTRGGLWKNTTNDMLTLSDSDPDGDDAAFYASASPTYGGDNVAGLGATDAGGNFGWVSVYAGDTLNYVELGHGDNSLLLNPNGVYWATYGTKPACASGVRGHSWRDDGAAGAADVFEMCMKDSADAYAWQPMVWDEASGITTLTESVATDFASMPIPQGDYVGGDLRTTLICADATDTSTLTERWVFSCHNNAGAEVCGLEVDGTFAISVDAPISWGTRTVAYTAGVDVVTFTMDTSCTGVTETTLDLAWEFDQVSAIRKAVTVIP